MWNLSLYAIYVHHFEEGNARDGFQGPFYDIILNKGVRLLHLKYPLMPEHPSKHLARDSSG